MNKIESAYKYSSSQKLVVLGAGESGVGAALLGKAKEYKVWVSDFGNIAPKYKQELTENQIEWEEGKHSIEKILEADLIVKSPGIPNEIALIQQAIGKNIPVYSEIEFASHFYQGKIIGITGSNGKTTTTSLVYHLLKEAKIDVAVGGNIGQSFARQILSTQTDWFVLELSSFQLDNIDLFKPYISLILNITPDHLNRYQNDMQRYINAKYRIIENQDSNDYFISFRDDKIVNKENKKRELNMQCISVSLENNNANSHIKNNKAYLFVDKKRSCFSLDLFPLEGDHNKINTLMALSIAKIVGISDAVLAKALPTFHAVEHRMEWVTMHNQVTYINDSKATNTNSTYYALKSMKSPTVWIVGGDDKGNDYSELDALVKEKVKAIVCMGINNTKIIEHFGSFSIPIEDTHSIHECVEKAIAHSCSGDTVLLSPACASFDLFKNYEERGKQFKEILLSQLK